MLRRKPLRETGFSSKEVSRQKGFSMLRRQSQQKKDFALEEISRKTGLGVADGISTKDTDFSARNVSKTAISKAAGGISMENGLFRGKLEKKRGVSTFQCRRERVSRREKRTRFSVTAPRRQSQQKTELHLEEISRRTGSRGKSLRKTDYFARGTQEKRGFNASGEILTKNEFR